jgi:hypothetical protein
VGGQIARKGVAVSVRAAACPRLLVLLHSIRASMAWGMSSDAISSDHRMSAAKKMAIK